MRLHAFFLLCATLASGCSGCRSGLNDGAPKVLATAAADDPSRIFFLSVNMYKGPDSFTLPGA